MKYKNIAIGMIPEGLSNLIVTVEWTPGERVCRIGFLDNNGKPFGGYGEVLTNTGADLGYTPTPGDLDMMVYRGLAFYHHIGARFARSLAGFAHFEWISPVEMSNRDRAKFGAGA